MKKLAIAALLLTSVLALNAQTYKVNIQMGGNTTFISKFDNTHIYVEDFLVPAYYNINSGRNISTYTKTTPIKLRPGFFADIAIEKMLQNNWSLNLSLGVDQVNYTYDGTIATAEYSNTPGGGSGIGSAVDLKSLYADYGDTKMLYLTSRALNVSKKWGRFTVTAGPQLNYLLSKKYANIILLDTDPSKEGYEDGIFETRGDANRLLIGAALSAKYHITPRLYLVAGG